MLGVFISPHYASDHSVYLTYSEPGAPSGSSLALARAQLKIGKDSASLENLKVIWRDGERGKGGQFGAAVAFSPDGKLSVPHGWRPAAHDAGPGSQPAARQDSAADARWQAGSGKSDGREDRRCQRARDRPASRIPKPPRPLPS